MSINEMKGNDVSYALNHLEEAISDINLLPIQEISYSYLKNEIQYHLGIVLDYLVKQKEKLDEDQEDSSAIS